LGRASRQQRRERCAAAPIHEGPVASRSRFASGYIYAPSRRGPRRLSWHDQPLSTRSTCAAIAELVRFDARLLGRASRSGRGELLRRNP
jgi:hypothetical protein